MPTTLVPIFFIHHGYADYLQWNIEHLRSRFPERKIIVISDHAYDHAQWVPIKNYKKTVFDSHYVHLSQVDQKFEVFCFKRWFILANVLKALHINDFIYLDSDCVLFDDQFPTDRLGIVGDPKSHAYHYTKSGHSLFSNQASLEKFCEFMMQTYTQAEGVEALKLLRQTRIGPRGGVTDMTLFGLFANKYPQEVHHQEVIINGVCSDDNFNESGGFKTDGTHKKIRIEAGLPYAYRITDDQKIMMRTLHFQGSAKAYMPHYLWGDQTRYRKLSWIEKLLKHVLK